jgi:hypothetical protein
LSVSTESSLLYGEAYCAKDIYLIVLFSYKKMRFYFKKHTENKLLFIYIYSFFVFNILIILNLFYNYK